MLKSTSVKKINVWDIGVSLFILFDGASAVLFGIFYNFAKELNGTIDFEQKIKLIVFLGFAYQIGSFIALVYWLFKKPSGTVVLTIFAILHTSTWVLVQVTDKEFSDIILRGALSPYVSFVVNLLVLFFLYKNYPNLPPPQNNAG
jgi:phosphate/sulfate permease